jgi:putative ABC transport system substrate-binding protein
LIALAAAAMVLCASPEAQAQQPTKLYRIGFVSPTTPGPTSVAFQQAFRTLGYVEGRNFVMEARYAEGRVERFPELIAEVLRSKVDILVIGSSFGAIAAKKATSTVPVVFAGLIDPVVPGIVASYARPGGNITGATFGIGGEGFGGKWVELLKEVAPHVSHIAALVNANSAAAQPLVPEMQAAAKALNVKLDIVDAASRAKLDKAFAEIGAGKARALIVTNDPFFFLNRAELVQFAAGKRLPAVYFTNDFVDAGGMMSYGSSLTDSYRRAAAYVDKILKGAKPAELPIDQPTTFELVINLKAAKALGLVIPQRLIVRADQVIER